MLVNTTKTTRWVAAVAAAVAATHVVVAFTVAGPTIFPDEFGQIAYARGLAGVAAVPHTFEYSPGLGVLLAPLAPLLSAAGLYRAILVLNAVACAAVVIGASVLHRRLRPAAPWWEPVVAAAAAGAYPALFAAAGHSWSESSFAAAAIWVVIAADSAARSGTSKAWAWTGVAAGATYLVHARGAAIIVAVAAFAIVVRAGFKTVVYLCGVAAVLAACLPLFAWTAVVAQGERANNPVHVLNQNGSVAALRRSAGIAFGQVLSACTASWGLIAIGVAVGVAALWRCRHRAAVDADRTSALIALVWLSMLALAALFLTDGDRADQLISGRYLDAVTPAVLVLSVIAVVEMAGTRARWAGRVVVAAPLVAAVAFAAAVPAESIPDELSPPMIPGVLWALSISGFEIRWEILLAVAVAGGVAVVAAARRSMLRAAAVVAVLYGVGTGAAAADNHLRADHTREVLAPLAAALEPVPAGTCVGVDERGRLGTVALYWLRIARPELTFEIVDTWAGRPPCSKLVVSGTGTSSVEAAYPTAELLVGPTPHAHGLYRLP